MMEGRRRHRCWMYGGVERARMQHRDRRRQRLNTKHETCLSVVDKGGFFFSISYHRCLQLRHSSFRRYPSSGSRCRRCCSCSLWFSSLACQLHDHHLVVVVVVLPFLLLLLLLSFFACHHYEGSSSSPSSLPLLMTPLLTHYFAQQSYSAEVSTYLWRGKYSR